METQKRVGQLLSYAYGIMIAAAVVACLISIFYFTSDSFAAQQQKKQSVAQQAELKTKSVAELVELIRPLARGRRPSPGPEQERVLAAIMLLGEGQVDQQNEVDLRIEGIAIAGNVSNTEYEAAALIAMKKLGLVSQTRFKEMLHSEDPQQMAQAAICLKLLGAEAAVFVPRLIEMIESGDPTITRHGVFALQNMGASATPAVEALNEVLLSLDFNAQIMACRAVVGIGLEAAPMADNLAEIFEKGNPSARSWAGIALGAIGPIENFDTAKMLASRLNAIAHVEKIRALEGLALMGDEAESQQELIKAAMVDPQGRVRPQAAYAYYCVTRQTEAAVKTLVELLASPSQCEQALRHLRLMGPNAEPAIPDVRKLLKHESAGIRESAVLVLGNMGAVAAGEIPAIKRLASDPDPLLSQAVEEAVAAIERDVQKKKAQGDPEG